MRLVVLCILLFFSVRLTSAEDVRYRLLWIYNDQFAGELYALEKEWYKKVGINLILQPYTKNYLEPYEAVKQGEADIGISETFSLIRKITNDDSDIIIFGLEDQLSPAGLLSLKNKNITKPKDLENKVHGYFHDGNLELLKWYSEVNHINFNLIKNVKIEAENLQPLISGDVDFVIAHETNEPVVLLLNGLKTNMLSLSGPNGIQFGVAFFCKRSFYETHREVLKKFLKTTSQGWKEAILHPEEASEIIMKYYPKEYYVFQSPELTKEKIFRGVKIRQFYLTYAVGLDHIGYMSETYWSLVFQKLAYLKLIDDETSLNKIIRFDVVKTLFE